MQEEGKGGESARDGPGVADSGAEESTGWKRGGKIWEGCEGREEGFDKLYQKNWRGEYQGVMDQNV